MKSAIVTGANGFVGHHLVKLLSDNEYKIYAIIRNKNENIDNIFHIQNVHIVYCDMEEIDNLPKLINDTNIDYVYHLAWAGSSGNLRTQYELQLNNAIWAGKLVEAIGKMGIKRLLVSGSVTQLMYRDYLINDNISPEMITCYAIGKISAEYICKCICAKYDIDLCWTYISNFYGADDPTNNFINFLLDNYANGITPELTTAEQLADFTYVTDIAKGLMYACERGKRNTSYYVGYGNPKPLKEFILELKQIVNPDIESGIGKKVFNGKSVDFSTIDVNKLSRDTGFSADIAFKEGISLLCKVKHIG